MSGGADRVAAVVRRVVAAQRRGNLTDAVAIVEHEIAESPRQARLHHQLGLLRARQRDWVGAVAAFESAAELAPGQPSRVHRVGLAREQAWDLSGAVEAYRAAVSLRPTWSPPVQRLDQLTRRLVDYRCFQGQVIAHRGTVRGWAENSIDALDRLPDPVAGVEVDARLSRDGVAVLMHDRTVDRTTDGAGAVAGMRYPELSALTGADGTAVPALADYLAACADRPLRQILVDIKVSAPDALGEIARVVRGSPAADRCTLMVRSIAQLKVLRGLGGELRLGFFGVDRSNVGDRVAAALAYGAELLAVAHGDRRYLRHREIVARSRAAGLRAGASVVNTQRALDAARQDGCDGVITDLADQLGNYVRAPDAPPAGDRGRCACRAEGRSVRSSSTAATGRG